jgi:dihydroxy-acid dehydratase
LIALVEDNDIIELDAVNNKITLKVAEDVIKKRRQSWKQPKLNVTKGILYKYAKHVKTAADGCVTDED